MKPAKVKSIALFLVCAALSFVGSARAETMRDFEGSYLPLEVDDVQVTAINPDPDRRFRSDILPAVDSWIYHGAKGADFIGVSRLFVFLRYNSSSSMVAYGVVEAPLEGGTSAETVGGLEYRFGGDLWWRIDGDPQNPDGFPVRLRLELKLSRAAEGNLRVEYTESAQRLDGQLGGYETQHHELLLGAFGTR